MCRFRKLKGTCFYFSETHWTLPNIAEVNEQFDAEYDQDEYEEKIARLIRNARDHAREESPVEFEGWSNAVKALTREDRYLLVMVAKAVAPSWDSSNRWIAALAAAVALAVVFYIEKPFLVAGSSSIRLMVWALVLTPLLAYVLVRFLFSRK
jgi:hypothetical protein